MRKLILLCLVATMATSCLCDGVNEVLYSVANDKRVTTKIKQDKHNQAMADSRALTQKRLEFKDTMYNAGMVSGVVLAIWFTIACVYWLIGSVHIGLQKKQIMVVEDPQGNRFPLLIRGNSVVNISTGERFGFTDRSPPNRMLTQSSTAVQLRLQTHNGNSKIIDMR